MTKKIAGPVAEGRGEPEDCSDSPGIFAAVWHSPLPLMQSDTARLRRCAAQLLGQEMSHGVSFQLSISPLKNSK